MSADAAPAKMLGSDPSMATASKMEVVQTAHAEMPGEREIGQVLARLHPSMFEADHSVTYCPNDRALVAARAILSLFAPILAEKEREIEEKYQAFSIAHDQAMANGNAAQLAQARALAAEAALAAERALLVRAKDYIVYNADSLSMNSPATLLVEEIVAAIRAGE